ncbi:toxin-antitoxin system HicB family antitoxin [Sulfobacillus thermosulfidooxidans]|uniref:toxin-antitoxin system HicB family antitoxin n=1 Tax=Sulfobacillus thermosulfidooxidans TaxID=28034 RepID=UPI0009EA8F83
MNSQDFEQLIQRPYRIEIYPAEEGGYVATIPDLPGCITQGETPEETLQRITDAKTAWILIALEQSIDIPMPSTHSVSSSVYSGKLNVRMPKSLHQALAQEAQKEGVSLNHLIVYRLTQSLHHNGVPRQSQGPSSSHSRSLHKSNHHE